MIVPVIAKPAEQAAAISFVAILDCFAEFILSIVEGLAMTERKELL